MELTHVVPTYLVYHDPIESIQFKYLQCIPMFNAINFNLIYLDGISSMGIFIIRIGRSLDHSICIMGTPILVRQCLYIVFSRVFGAVDWPLSPVWCLLSGNKVLDDSWSVGLAWRRLILFFCLQTHICDVNSNFRHRTQRVGVALFVLWHWTLR